VLRRQTGFGLIAALFLLVILAALGIAITFIVGVQQNTASLDALGSQAYQAARAGVEWAAYQVTGSTTPTCNGTLTFAGTSLQNFTTTVTCTQTITTEGSTTIRLYNIVSDACDDPNAGACPNTGSTSKIYTERQLTVVIGGL